MSDRISDAIEAAKRALAAYIFRDNPAYKAPLDGATAAAEAQARIAGLIGDLLHLAQNTKLDPVACAQQGLVKYECDRRWPADGIAPDRNDVVDVRITTEHRTLQHVRIDRDTNAPACD